MFRLLMLLLLLLLLSAAMPLLKLQEAALGRLFSMVFSLLLYVFVDFGIFLWFLLLIFFSAAFLPKVYFLLPSCWCCVAVVIPLVAVVNICFVLWKGVTGFWEARLDLNFELWGSKTERKRFLLICFFFFFGFVGQRKCAPVREPTKKKGNNNNNFGFIILQLLWLKANRPACGSHAPHSHSMGAFERFGCRSTLKTNDLGNELGNWPKSQKAENLKIRKWEINTWSTWANAPLSKP